MNIEKYTGEINVLGNYLKTITRLYLGFIEFVERNAFLFSIKMEMEGIYSTSTIMDFQGFFELHIK